MKSYRDLEIYTESKRLAILVHAMTLKLPKFEMFEEGGQVRRSSKSVTSMIVEGYCRRRYKPDYIKHLVYAQAECDETIVHLEFLRETGSATNVDNVETLLADYEILSKRINNILDGWRITSIRDTRQRSQNCRSGTKFPNEATGNPATSNQQQCVVSKARI